MSENDITVMNRTAITLARAKGARISAWSGRPKYDKRTPFKGYDEPYSEDDIGERIDRESAEVGPDQEIVAQLNRTIMEARRYREREQANNSDSDTPLRLQRRPIRSLQPSSPSFHTAQEGLETIQSMEEMMVDPELEHAIGLSREEYHQREVQQMEFAAESSMRHRPTVEDDQDEDRMHDD
ncbi:MAG: hypothetical protein M1823_005941 [Watsoniomyces obsoletus]|nr:MAG: hypothetical protein M1823_005941 [Watsoniomyces obsoletus]